MEALSASGTLTLDSPVLNFKDLIQPDALGLDAAGRDRFLDRHERIIEDYFEALGAELNGDDWASRELDYDPDTAPDLAAHTHPGLSSNLLRHIAECSAAEEPIRSRGVAMRLTSVAIDRMIEDRHGLTQISDACAIAIAHNLSADRHYPALHQLSVSGYAPTDTLVSDLRQALEANTDQMTAQRIGAMFSWVRCGGDNH